MTPDDDAPAALPEIESLAEEQLAEGFFQTLKLSFEGCGVEPECDAKDLVVLHRVATTRHDDAIEHVFSHVKHYLHISHHTVSEQSAAPDSWESREGRQLRWMTMDELAQVGITTGVKKVLQAVQRAGKTKTKRKSGATASTTKAIAEGAGDKKQRTLKDFF